MSIIRILLPLFYCVIVGTAYSLVFRKKFIDSLAPVFGVQIILILLAGITFEKLSLGIWIGAILAIGIIVIVCAIEKSLDRLIDVFCDSSKSLDLSVCLFVIIYFIIFLSNVGKHYNMWDEFSHWGWFVRESYNNDFLYCISQKIFEHKEYVPGVTIFETLWCRLSLKYSEPNAYRGIQMLQASMLLPVVTRISTGVSQHFADKARKMLLLVVNLFIIFAVPLFSELPFYHTLYEDLILGVFVFYCIWITVSEEFGRYSLFLFGLSLSNLMLCKMTGLAFVPVLFLFYAVWHNLFSDKTISRIRIWIGAVISVAISVIPWRLYNSYVKAKSVIGMSQNYGSVELGSVLDVITHNGAISYQSQVEEAYLSALAQKGIIGNLSYIWIVLGCTVLLLLFMLVVDNKEDKKRIGLITLWGGLAGIYYAFLMYFMYMLMFSEYEATGIASYTRYMSTYVLIMLLIVAMTFIVYGSARFRFVSYLAAIMLAENVLVFCDAFQLLPGIFTHDEVWYEGHVDYLNNSLPEGANVLFICSLADMNAVGRVQFYCDDISLTGGIFGASQYEGDVWSQDLSVPEFIDRCASSDYVYFFSYDDSFVELYQDAFADKNVIALGKLYKVERVGDKIQTYPVN